MRLLTDELKEYNVVSETMKVLELSVYIAGALRYS
jgi:hypothetical protein